MNNNIQKYMSDAFIGFCVSFSCGYIAFYDKRFVKFAKYRYLNNSVGLSYIAKEIYNSILLGSRQPYSY